MMATKASRRLRLLLYIPVPWLYVLVYLAGVGMERLWPIRLPDQVQAGYRVTETIGMTVFALGAALAIWGWVVFLRARTTTVPGKRSAQFVTWGPYRFTRNPMYVGMVIAYIGECFILRHVWPLVLLPIVIACLDRVVIPVEEERLTEVFGERYTDFQRRVRRWV